MNATITQVIAAGDAYATGDDGRVDYIMSTEFYAAHFMPVVGERIVLESRADSDARWLVGLELPSE